MHATHMSQLQAKRSSAEPNAEHWEYVVYILRIYGNVTKMHSR